MPRELNKYVEEARKFGTSDEAIRQELLRAGWKSEDVAKVMGNGPAFQATSLNSATRSPAGFSNVITSVMPDVSSSTNESSTSQIPTVGQPVSSWSPQPSQNSGHSRPRAILMPLILFLVVATIAGAFYFYLKSTGFFAKPPYTEDNLVSGLLAKSSQITSASYHVAFSLNVGDRDIDAKPFSVTIPDDSKLKAQYKNDKERADAVFELISSLRYSHYKKGIYPSALSSLGSVILQDFSKDPLAGKTYEYYTTENGKNFSLKVTFETTNAVRSVRGSYNFSSSTTLINGQTVTFTKDSPSYIYLPSVPPKPFLAQLADSLRTFPSDIAFNGSISAASYFKQDAFSRADQSNWKFNADGSGSFGDLSYAVNADALRIEDIYYLRVNKIPSLPFFDLSAIKGEWIEIDPKAATSSETTRYDALSFSLPISDYEESYRNERAEFVDLIKKVATIADKERLFVFQDKPKLVKADDRRLYQYNLKIRKEAIVPFYESVIDEVKEKKLASLNDAVADQGALDYLKSKEFDEVFDFIDRNTIFTIWVDARGFPAVIESRFRLVPPDTAFQLKDKQINFVTRMILSDINESIEFDTPQGARPIQEVMENMYKNFYPQESDDYMP